MKRLFFLLLCLFGYHFISAQSDITGIWQGYLHIAKDSLAVVLVIDNKQEHFTVFVLSCVVGYYVVWNVSHSLHTPLMAVTNAISGIIVVGALVQLFGKNTDILINVLCFIAVLIASINIFGGFSVTKRMLKMFRKD